MSRDGWTERSERGEDDHALHTLELFHKSAKVSYIPHMPVDPELLEILACPSCKTPVTLVKNGTALKCATCKRVYPIKDDIPVMLIDEATIEND
jgi:LSD1 subclass zinc finger protein